MTDVSTTYAEAIFRVNLTLKMASAQVVETSVTYNSSSQDSYHPDDLFQSRHATPGFKPFSYLQNLVYLFEWEGRKTQLHKHLSNYFILPCVALSCCIAHCVMIR